MTENKRFKHSEFQQDDGQYQYYGIEDTSVNCVYNVIGNGMYDESEKQLIDILNFLNDENKELKQFKEKVFSLIDDKIIFVNACEETSRILKEDYYRGALEILELLKKELQE